MRYAYIKYGDIVGDLRHIGPAPASIPLGGPMTFAASFLQLIGNNPALLISWGGGASGKSEHFQVDSIDAYTIESYKGKNISKILKIFFSINTFIKLLRFRPQITFCVLDGPGLWTSYLATRILGVPLVHSRQRAISVEGDTLRRKWIAKVDAFVLRKVAGVVCHGPFGKDQLIKIGVQADKIIEFDIHFDDIKKEVMSTAGSPAHTRDPGRKRIFFVGRVEESKGVFDLLEASLPLMKDNPDVDIVFVGEGSAIPRLKQISQQENVSDRIEFTGRVSHEQIGVQLKDATLLATPTRHGLEGWPMAALEGQAMGVPVIAPDAGPFPFMVENGVNGLLFNVNSVKDLRDKLKLALNNDDLKNQLSQGAIATSVRREQSSISFIEALHEAVHRFHGTPD